MGRRHTSRHWWRAGRSAALNMVLLATAMLVLGSGVSQLASEAPRPAAANASRLEPTTPHARHFGSDPVLKDLAQVLARDGIEAAMARLDDLSATDRSVRARKHPYVHDLGWLAYEHYRDVDEAFRRCPSSPDTGCHHGVVQAYLAWAPRFDRGDVNQFCDGGALEVGALELLRFQCFHGLGHGLMMLYHNNLDESLAACDHREAQRDRDPCYAGVFMESIEHFDYAWERSRQMSFEPISPETSLLTLCRQVANTYRPACYLHLPMAILPANDFDFAAGFATCERAPAAFIVNCYQGMGGMAAVVAVDQPSEAQGLCGLGSAPYRVWCAAGGARTLMSVHGRADEALSFCAASPPEIAAFCFEVVGEGMPAIHGDAAAQRSACEQAGRPEWEMTCLYAAGLGA